MVRRSMFASPPDVRLFRQKRDTAVTFDFAVCSTPEVSRALTFADLRRRAYSGVEPASFNTSSGGVVSVLCP